MKKISAALFMLFALTACSPKVGSEQWCADLKEKDKSAWTAEEAKDFAKHCIF
ncbi:DUF3012 domain-containing protein [Thalassotalea sp. PLHSN55]|uniref:DUF3012 domain-containing protein n=1 Tax=Thalassotalea sp. PLHSN55 TaxID=3435888 RepID=UPI003F875E0F